MFEDDRNADLSLNFSLVEEDRGSYTDSLSMDEIEEVLAEIRF